LCLKFELDFDIEQTHALSEQDPRGWHKGLMVSGSSDCSVCVWDLYCHPTGDDEDMIICAELRGVLRGHSGGVLDLRIEKDYIISWYVSTSSRLCSTLTKSPSAVKTQTFLCGIGTPSRCINLSEDMKALSMPSVCRVTGSLVHQGTAR
jgi:hypothetical protein